MVTLMGLCWLTVAHAASDGCAGAPFQQPVRYASAAGDALLIADLDGDRAPEILASGNHVDERAAFSLLLNRGDGTFASERQIGGGFGQRLEDVADLDRDGIPDLLASDFWSNGIAVYHGLGTLQFGAGAAYATATHGGPSRVLDYDGDGLSDVVSFSFGSGNPVRVHLFRGNADGTLGPKTTFETGLAIAASPSTRIRDGVPEILVAEHSGHLALVRLAGGGVSVSRLDAGPGLDVNSLFADVNGDGTADIVDTNDGGGEAGNPFEWIFVTLARADGSFLERKQLAGPRRVTFPTELRAADFDGDAHVDLVVGDFRATTLYWFRGDGAGGFAEGVAFDAGGPVNDLAVGDLNGDGHPDLVTANDDGSVSVILNRGGCVASRRRAVRH